MEYWVQCPYTSASLLRDNLVGKKHRQSSKLNSWKTKTDWRPACHNHVQVIKYAGEQNVLRYSKLLPKSNVSVTVTKYLWKLIRNNGKFLQLNSNLLAGCTAVSPKQRHSGLRLPFHSLSQICKLLLQIVLSCHDNRTVANLTYYMTGTLPWREGNL